MEPHNFSIKSLGFKYGIIATVVFIIVFLIARATHFNDFSFHFINYIFLAVCIALALNEARKTIHKHRINYLPGLGIGFWTSVTTAMLFSLFLLLYSNVFNKGFIEEIRPFMPFSEYLSAGMISFVAFGETIAFGVIFSFIFMQLFKRNRGIEAEAQEEEAERHPEGNLSNTNK
ncbi:MAG: DUF4199 domain-containing protein [Bacteroidia bacterium]